MPFKLIFIIILMVLVAVVTGFNLDNLTSVWFFHTFTDVPVIAAVLGSFVAGVLVTLPFTFGKKRGRKDAPAQKAPGAREQRKAAKLAAKGAKPAAGERNPAVPAVKEPQADAPEPEPSS